MLSSKPAATAPIFVGRWRSNNVDRYVVDTAFRYVGERFSATDDFDPADASPQYRLDRKTLQLSTNVQWEAETNFLGVFPSGKATFTFRLPVHPVYAIKRVYNNRDLSPLSWEFNQRAGTLRVTVNLADVENWAATLVFVEYVPAIAVYSDLGGKDTIRVDEVELNPAFAGLANGYVYLQHKIWQPKSVMLQVDKPRVPYANLAENPEDIEFGPVYEEDSAVLTVTAFGSNETELIAALYVNWAGFSSLFSRSAFLCRDYQS